MWSRRGDGVGTPRSLQGCARVLFDALECVLRRFWRLVSCSDALVRRRLLDPRRRASSRPLPESGERKRAHWTRPAARARKRRTSHRPVPATRLSSTLPTLARVSWSWCRQLQEAAEGICQAHLLRGAAIRREENRAGDDHPGEGRLSKRAAIERSAEGSSIGDLLGAELALRAEKRLEQASRGDLVGNLALPNHEHRPSDRA